MKSSLGHLERVRDLDDFDTNAANKLCKLAINTVILDRTKDNELNIQKDLSGVGFMVRNLVKGGLRLKSGIILRPLNQNFT